MNAAIPQDAFKQKLLDEKYHERLLMDVEKVTEQAGIPLNFVWSKLSDYCDPEDSEWVRGMRLNNDCGLAYVGNFENPVADKMMAITGACLRNYIDAKFIPLQDVAASLKRGHPPVASVLLIPNFCIGKAGVDDVPPWEVSALLGMLYTRLAKNQKTVLYIGSMAALEKNYGTAFKQHITNHFTVIE